MSSCCTYFFDKIANKKFDNDILHEFKVSSVDALNLSSHACKELKFKVSACDTSNSWSQKTMSSCCTCFFDEIANKKFDNNILHEFKVSSIDTLNLSSYAYKELKLKVSASDTSNSWS